MWLAIAASWIFGAGMPGFCFFFGGMIDGMGEGSGDMSALKNSAVSMLYLGFGVWIFSWMQVTFWAQFAARISHKTRIKYFKSCLEKDAAFYDF